MAPRVENGSWPEIIKIVAPSMMKVLSFRFVIVAAPSLQKENVPQGRM
jgi:hypothetical protein